MPWLQKAQSFPACTFCFDTKPMAMTFDYRPLPPKFRQGGFNFQQLMRQGDVILLKKWKSERPASFHYEIIIVRKIGAREVFGKRCPASEMLPSNEQWGRIGWSPYDLPAAKQKFHWALEMTSATGMPRILHTARVFWDFPTQTDNVPDLSLDAS